MASFTLRFNQSCSLSRTLKLSMETLWPVALQWSPTPVGLFSLQCSLESNAEGSLRLPNVGVEGVVVTRDVVDGPHNFSLGIHIKQRAPSMNRDQGYQLPSIYGQIIPRPPPHEPNHPPWSLRDQDLLEADRNVAIVSPSVPKWAKFNHFLYESWNHE